MNDPVLDALLTAYMDHTDACPIAIQDPDDAVMGRCPYCCELRRRCSNAMNGLARGESLLYDDQEWAKQLEGHAAYRKNNPKPKLDELCPLSDYARSPALPATIIVNDAGELQER